MWPKPVKNLLKKVWAVTFEKKTSAAYTQSVNEPVKHCFFNGNIQGYSYLLTEVFIQVGIAIKVAMSSEKRDLIECKKHRYTFEKMKSNEIHEI